MVLKTELIARLLNTPAAKQAEQEIADEHERKRRELERRLAKLKTERAAAIAKADPAFVAARKAHSAAEVALRDARKTLDAAFYTLNKARSLNGKEIRAAEAELAELARDEVQA